MYGIYYGTSGLWIKMTPDGELGLGGPADALRLRFPTADEAAEWVREVLARPGDAEVRPLPAGGGPRA